MNELSFVHRGWMIPFLNSFVVTHSQHFRVVFVTDHSSVAHLDGIVLTQIIKSSLADRQCQSGVICPALIIPFIYVCILYPSLFQCICIVERLETEEMRKRRPILYEMRYHANLDSTNASLSVSAHWGSINTYVGRVH